MIGAAWELNALFSRKSGKCGLIARRGEPSVAGMTILGILAGVATLGGFKTAHLQRPSRTYRTKEELVAGFEFVLELGDQTFTMD